jgi:hypothetical protein
VKTLPKQGEKSMKKMLFTLALLASFSIVALGDIPRPPTPKPTPGLKQKKSIDAQLSITLRKTETAKLKIPRSQINQLRAQLDAIDGRAENTAAAGKTGGFTGAQTIVSGAFLSLALVFGGLWFVRSKSSESKAARGTAIAAFLFLSGSVAAVVWANAGPPPEARSITGKMFTEAVHMYKQGSGEIKLMVNDEDDDRIELVVPDPNGFPDNDEE